MRSALALVLSLALTGALLAMNYALLKSHGGLPGLGDERKVTVTAKRAVRHLALPLAPLPTTNAPPFHWRALESPDYVLYAANLRAVGCPEHTLRDILLPDIEKEFERQKDALRADTGDSFWETADVRDARERSHSARQHAIELKKRALIQRLLGAEMSFEALKELRSDRGAMEIVELLLGFADLAKSDQMLTIHLLRLKDGHAYEAATEGILLDEDVAALQGLRDRFEAELARTLAPSEMEELRLRLTTIKGLDHLNRRDGVNVSGSEMREIARLRADTKDMFALVLDLEHDLYSGELLEKGDSAFELLLRRHLGADRHADLERAKDGLFRDLLQSTEKQGVTKAALLRAYESRRAAEVQALEIRGDAQFSREEQEVLLAALRAQTAQSMARSLGPAGFGAYLKEHGQQLTNSLSMPQTRPSNGTVLVR
jgi:hypothetical protein